MDLYTLRDAHPDHWNRAAALRFLAMDAVAAANSGHTGMPMGMADVATVHGPMTVLVEVGEAIEVSAERSRDSEGDPLMQQLETGLQRLISGLAAEVEQTRLRAGGREETT